MTDPRQMSETQIKIEHDLSKRSRDILIETALVRPDIFLQARGAFEPELFKEEGQGTKRYYQIMTCLHKYYDEYGKMPSKTELTSLSGWREEFIGIDLMTDEIKSGERDGFLKETIRRHYESSMFDKFSNENYHLMDVGDYSGFVNSMAESFASVPLFAPTAGKSAGRDMDEFFKSLTDKQENLVGSGWERVDDKLDGGFLPGEMNLIVGKSGSGKSLMLANMAVNMAEAGKKVLFISLEMSWDRTMQRVARMMTGKYIGNRMNTRELYDLRSAMTGKVEILDRIVIEEMTAPTPADIESLLIAYRTKGVEFDALIVDYWDLCLPNDPKLHGREVWARDDKMAWEFKQIVGRNNVIFVTASQTNSNVKDRAPGEQYELTMIAGGQAKPRVIETCIFLEKMDNTALIKKATKDKDIPPKYETLGYRLFFVKTRNSAGGAFEEMAWNSKSLRLTNARLGADLDTGDVPKPKRTSKTAGADRKTEERVMKLREKGKRK